MQRLPVFLIFFFSLHFLHAQDSIWLAKTTGALPFLEYGIGDDRLGGAKMTYLDSNIQLKIVDSFNFDYKVQLSKYRTAYIAKDNVVLLHKVRNRPQPNNINLSGSIKVSGDENYDYVSVNLSERLPYQSMQMIDPSRVVIDVFGVTSNTNWITQLKSAREIKNTWTQQVDDDVFRIFIQLKHTQHWGYKLMYDSTGKRLIVRIKRQPTVLDMRKLRIAIDAGHGGDNHGTAGVTSKILEKDYTLLMAKETEKLLKKMGVKKVIMTRIKDTSLSMPERIHYLDSLAPDLLVSIHLNSSDVDTVRGVSTYYRYIGFRPLSVAIENQMLTLGLKEFGNVGNFNFSLSGPTAYPNALVEVAFLSNREDEKKVLKPAFHKAVAQKIVAGIAEWLKQIK